jgi:carboxymethylenebutenolidase
MKGTRVSIPVNGSSIEVYIAPAAGGRGPGVIVIQEWWGLVPHIESVSDRFASEGFTALAPDLYHGTSTTSPDEAGKLMMALDVESAAQDLRAATKHLVSHPATQGDKVGVVGFCMGGMLSMFAASANPEIGACINYYGVHPDIHPDFKNLKAPVLGFFGEKDKTVPPAVVADLERTMKAAGCKIEFHSYDNAGHAFFNDQRPAVYVESAAQDSWNRSIAFLRAYLGT